MTRDLLILVKPDFVDPTLPGERFYCWHCALMEGILVSFSRLATQIDVLRVDWARPRREVIDLVGTENQSLPLLILGEDSDLDAATGTYNGRTFIQGKEAILEALSRRHGIPVPHP